MLFIVRQGFYVRVGDNHTRPGEVVALTAAAATAHLHKLEPHDDEAEAFIAEHLRRSTVEPAQGGTLSIRRKV